MILERRFKPDGDARLTLETTTAPTASREITQDSPGNKAACFAGAIELISERFDGWGSNASRRSRKVGLPICLKAKSGSDTPLPSTP